MSGVSEKGACQNTSAWAMVSSLLVVRTGWPGTLGRSSIGTTSIVREQLRVGRLWILRLGAHNVCSVLRAVGPHLLVEIPLPLKRHPLVGSRHGQLTNCEAKAWLPEHLERDLFLVNQLPQVHHTRMCASKRKWWYCVMSWMLWKTGVKNSFHSKNIGASSGISSGTLWPPGWKPSPPQQSAAWMLPWTCASCA